MKSLLETLESEFVTFFKVDKDVSLSIAKHTLQKAAKNLKIRIDEARNTGDMFQVFRFRAHILPGNKLRTNFRGMHSCMFAVGREVDVVPIIW